MFAPCLTAGVVQRKRLIFLSCAGSGQVPVAGRWHEQILNSFSIFLLPCPSFSSSFHFPPYSAPYASPDAMRTLAAMF